MKKNNKINQDKLNEFFEETERKQKNPEVCDVNPVDEFSSSIKKYKCPKCNNPMSSREEECPCCHYKGYVPMSDDETKRVRTILFFIILAIALAVMVITRL
jgi:rubrerythrin